MRLAYFDAGAGVSGDMMLGALVDAGLGLDGLRGELRDLDLHGYDLAAEQVQRAGMRACHVHVKVEDHVHARRIGEILNLIDASRLRPEVKRDAIKVFKCLGEAEAFVHGKRIDEIHLHEAGAVDALVDVVGSVAGLAALGVEKVVFSPLRLGHGTVVCAHGILPVPPPAVAELVKGIPVYAGDVEGEMVTPTGAALAKSLADGFGPMPPMTPESTGHGAGTADRTIANILRLFLGECSDELDAEVAELVVLEANVDDMNPEIIAYLCERLQNAGALDVWTTPIQMKKGRPAVMLSILAHPDSSPALREIVFRESTTFGLREKGVLRYALKRESLIVHVEDRPVRVKIGRFRGRAVQLSPEYEDCRRVAIEIGLPIKDVYESAVHMSCESLQMDDISDKISDEN